MKPGTGSTTNLIMGDDLSKYHGNMKPGTGSTTNLIMNDIMET